MFKIYFFNLCLASSLCSTLTFINLNGDSRLVIRSCREDLGLLCGHHSVPGDQLGHYSSNGLNTKSQGAHIQKNHITCKRGKILVIKIKFASSVWPNKYYSVGER